jgi:hypothetical protein
MRDVAQLTGTFIALVWLLWRDGLPDTSGGNIGPLLVVLGVYAIMGFMGFLVFVLWISLCCGERKKNPRES